MDFAFLVDHRVKRKNENMDEFLDFARDLKKLWNMRVTVMPVVIGVLESFLKDLSKTRHNWVGQVIHWDLSKELKFDYTN